MLYTKHFKCMVKAVFVTTEQAPAVAVYFTSFSFILSPNQHLLIRPNPLFGLIRDKRYDSNSSWSLKVNTEYQTYQ